jgi:hypothetical protein
MMNARSQWRRPIINLIWAAVIGGLLWFIFRSEHSPLFFVTYMHHLNRQQERFILYNTDHVALGRVLRQFADDRKWAREDFSADSPQIPVALRVLKPSAIWMFEDYVEVEFGGPFGDIGFRAFRPGLKGYGTKELGDGLWLYTEDGYPNQ